MRNMRFKSTLNNIINTNKYFLIMLIISTVLSIVLLFMPIQNSFILIKFVPFSFVFSLLIFIIQRRVIGLGSMAIIIVYLFRMCILPIISAYGDFYHSAYPQYYVDKFNLASLMMIIETITVFMSLSFFQEKYLKRLDRKTSEKYERRVNFNDNPIIYILTISFGVMIIAFLVMYPMLRNYSRLFFVSKSDYISNYTLIQGAISSYGKVYYIFKRIFEFSRPLITFFILDKVLSSNSVKNKLVISLIVAITSLVFVSNEQINSALVSIICFYNIISHYSRESSFFIKKTIKNISIIGLVSFMLYGLYFFSSSGSPQLISRAYQIYFGGPSVMAIGLGITSKNPLRYLLNDIYNGSTLLVGLYGYKESTSDLINAFVNEAAKGTFFSFIVQSKFFFGFLAPITIILVVWLIVKVDMFSESSTNRLYSMIYQYISFSLAVFLIMYSFTMVLNYIIYTVLLYIIIIKIDKKIVFRKR